MSLRAARMQSLPITSMDNTFCRLKTFKAYIILAQPFIPQRRFQFDAAIELPTTMPDSIANEKLRDAQIC